MEMKISVLLMMIFEIHSIQGIFLSIYIKKNQVIRASIKD